jgi:L-lactate permease
MRFYSKLRANVFGGLLTVSAAAITLSCMTMSPACLQAQLITGSISGHVIDPSNAVVAKAEVSLLNQATGDTRKSVSNDAGYFTFAGVIPGTYTVIESLAVHSCIQQSEDFCIKCGD